MPHPDEHAKQATATFGRPFLQVHKWLDEFHDVPGYGGVAHRRKRHHTMGVRQIEQMWGPDAARAAIQHIQADLEQVGWTGDFPYDEADCVKKGLWVTR